MSDYKIMTIEDIQAINLCELLKESEQEGFRFVKRLVQDYRKGINRFNRPGEGLFGVFANDGRLLAIGGINREPYMKIAGTGRLRRFYVTVAYRRKGIGKALLDEILTFATRYFSQVVLNTDTEAASAFYLANGFEKLEAEANATHILKFN